MQPAAFTLIYAALIALPSVSAYAVSAWSGSACSGIEVGSLEGETNPNGLTAAEATPNALCVHFDQALDANCDVYLCADAACNDQGTTVEGPQDANTRMENVDFQGMQVGCQ